MAGINKTVSAEDPAGPLDGTELSRIVQGGASKRTTLQDIANLAHTPLTTKGDLLGFSTTATRIPVGSNGDYALVPDSTQALGVKWAGPFTRVSDLADTSSGSNGAGRVGFLYSLTYTANTVGAWLKNLATVAGAAFMGTSLGVTGAVLLTVEYLLRQRVTPQGFGAVADGSTDNSTAFSALTTYLNTFSGTNTPPRVFFPAGTYNYSATTNWAVSFAKYEFAPGVIFNYTGGGSIAMDFDGGAAGSGVTAMHVTGFPLIGGNATTATAVRTRAVHRSHFELRVRNATTQGLLINFAVCNVYHVKCTTIGEPLFSPTPVTGILMDKRGTGEFTSACTFINPIMEGVSGYGLNLANATQNEIIGGTSEANGGGMFVSGTSTANVIHGLDCETNASADIFCQGLYNRFENILSSTTSNIAGQTNVVLGGRWNTLQNTGIDNRYYDVLYSTNGGSFTDSGSGILKRVVRNATTNALDTDFSANPQSLRYTYGPVGFGHVYGSADQLVVGGSANDTVFYKFGNAQQQFWVNNSKNLSLGFNTMGFYGTAPIAQPATGGASSTFTVNTGTAVNTGSTFDGYTIAQVVKALRNTGLLQ